MARMGYGYGSECHLLRWMGRHRILFENKITELIGIPNNHIEFLDFKFDPGEIWSDRELKAVEFINENHPAYKEWDNYWPQIGNAPNWDAVCKVIGKEDDEWILIEAKAHIEELKSSCAAKELGGLPKIKAALQQTIDQLEIEAVLTNWLEPYYQYANRLAVLAFLHKHKIKARLVNVYFVGDITRKGWKSPQTIDEWKSHIERLESHLGLSYGHKLTSFVHNLYLNIAAERVS